MTPTFGTKAETLESIRSRLSKSRVLPSVFFTVEDWRKQKEAILDSVHAEFPSAKVIVRSSAQNEDSAVTAMAGMHASVADVSGSDPQALSQAIERVIESYGSGGEGGDQILVQPMVLDVSMSGVIFTQDLNTGSPYYVINYDDVSGKTDTVTSGYGDCNKTLLVHRGHEQALESTRFRALLSAVVEIEDLFPGEGLDIEFSVTRSEEIYVFQVRRLTVQRNWSSSIEKEVNASLDHVETFLKAQFKPCAFLFGRTTYYGEMSDWNPAEMIGITARALPASLYRTLITDSVWAEARARMGYRDLSRQPLMVSLGGRYFIDLRKSFNSFLPAELSDAMGERLVNHWLDRLERSPELHDKIEFEVASTVYPLDFEERVRPELERAGCSKEEVDHYSKTLRALTGKVLENGGRNPIVQAELALVERLRGLHAQKINRYPASQDSLNLVRELIFDCREYGTRPFAALARCAFIAEEMLRSLRRLGVLSEERILALKQSIPTVLTEFLVDVRSYQAGRKTLDELMKRYGHLRPGTYNIQAPRYDQRASAFSSSASQPTNGSSALAEFRFTASEERAVTLALDKCGFGLRADQLLEFVRTAIAGREFAKFEFTRNISDVLELIARWGQAHGLSREELSHLSLGEIMRSADESFEMDLASHFRSVAAENQRRQALSQALRLPYLITSLSDTHVVPLLRSRPNFITRKAVQAPVRVLGGDEATGAELTGHIVAIEGADPGYDWIFMSKIAGLVTKYGGANSHMAIRCAELGIQAAIGCGEQIYDLVLNSEEIFLGCDSGYIHPVV